MAKLPWPFSVTILFMAFNTLMVQLFFMWRLWKVASAERGELNFVQKVYMSVILLLALYAFGESPGPLLPLDNCAQILNPAFAIWVVCFCLKNPIITSLSAVFPAGPSGKRSARTDTADGEFQGTLGSRPRCEYNSILFIQQAVSD